MIGGVRRALCVLVALVALAAPAGAAAPDRPLWLGPEFEGLAMSGRDPGRVGSSDVVSFFYGEPPPEGGAAPIEVQNWSICDRHPLSLDVRPERILRLRGVPVADYGRGGFEVFSARTNVVLFGLAGEPARRAVAALRAETGDPALDRPLPAARFPRWVLRELKLVRNVTRRAGTGRAVRRRLGISRSAIRMRLRLARVLGSDALRGVRPATMTPGEVIRDRRAMLNVQEGGDLAPGDRRRAARHRARIRRC